ncbi:MAG: glycoside hydrolase family 5 protein [Erysipelotrichaceae bacterium]|nr:glycoside hydrolase family 5 protein [Erysipelotrichaceae bacterium]
MRKFEGFQHGINLGGWLSQCDYREERYENFIKEEDIRRISEWGLDHIRIPIDYNLVEDEQGGYLESGFAHLKDGVDWALKYGLNVIIDLHKTYGYSFDRKEGEEGFFEKEEYQERFYRLWEEIARRFGPLGDRVAFELLNEVTDKEYCEVWNAIAEKCVKRIRKICPQTRILIGGYYNNSVVAVKDLWKPHDENIVYNFHCYNPLVFTHQGAYWIPRMPHDFRIGIDEDLEKMRDLTPEVTGRLMSGYDESREKLNADYFRGLFAEAIKVAEERDVPLYCGEYGVINLADPEETLRWYQMIHEVFEEKGIGRAAWSYKEMDFGFIDEHLKDVLDDIIKLL